ncbi:hypothetical protein POL68_37870 [Stigmatella sp. ncwal1]|uniref:Chromosome segregation ATPase n=1 Tax=Stigmatella ashevillensis TaxID=2995309 RepID=A0ABT5DL79_9BACT|nr:hypothetical protein [Stigmatella ashevillena]MDC0714291.1 hypothetical protein [Stigmatella ashevillena]
MKVLGLVQWTERDKRGSPIAGVRPLVEIQKGEWRTIEALEEFPSRGQVFWPNAQVATENSLVIFHAESNAGQKDEFRVVDPKLVYEVLDLRRYGTATEVRAALIEGIRLPVQFGAARALVWCKPDLLVGPVELNRVASGTVRLVGTNLHRLAAYKGAQVRSVPVDHAERLLRVDDTAPSSYVDWDDDAIVLRRALESAVRVAKQAGHDTGQTKKQIEDAARALAAQGGPDALLDRYRLERALTLLENTDVVVRSAGELAESLREHPTVKASLDEFSVKVRTEVEQRARADLEQGLAVERAALGETTEALAQTKLLLETRAQELHKAEELLAEVQSLTAKTAKAAEAAVDARVLAALERPLELLAEVSVLRPFLGAGGSRAESATNAPASSPAASPQLDWARARGEVAKDVKSLRSSLSRAARTHRFQGEPLSMLLQIHAAIAAGLMPITLGPSALAALTAYAHGACGGRLHIVHVSPSAIHAHDFDYAPRGGIVVAAAAAKDIDGISLVVLEGANRSPLEASVVPLLQLADVGLSPVANAPGLRLAASLVVGATTVPVTPQLWSHAVAIHPGPSAPATQGATLGDAPRSSELFALGDEPKGAIDALLDAWPDCHELRPAMSRFGAALTQLYDEEDRISDALRSGLVLPYIATALSPEEQAEALANAGDGDGALALALRGLRRRLA